ncbi:hypothetical protein SAMN05443245_5207 [Paraburkholderia fungorum]|uniref:Uncharacterized protein n=1 Tax=Paraburkholderia fungorum TaxID=134537 RepID=A0A1H1II99_9BURK|nr:hypothetical protein SAMN05443245_5207 [Paraburkholderia fungorum]
MYKAVLAFAGHATAAAALFVIIGLVAFLLGRFVHLLAEWGLDPNLVIGLSALEYVLFGFDVISLLFFLFSAFKVAYREMSE